MSDDRGQVVALPRLQTGIAGLDAVSGGGLPAGESTLVCGMSGTGKSVLAMQFLALGILRFDQPAVYVTFEQAPAKVRASAAGLGWDVAAWEARGAWTFVDASRPAEHEVTIGAALDLEPLIARIADAVRRVGAKRVVLDTLTSMHARLGDTTLVRAELHRVIGALDQLGVTAIITAERDGDDGPVARYGVEEFVADNIIILRNVPDVERRRRTLEVLKFRGGQHAAGEFPFAILADRGLEIVVLGQTPLTYRSSEMRISMGNAQLDEMLGGGAFQASVTLISGATGTGKSLLALEFVTAGAEDERALLIAFEESADQITRNARAWNLDLAALQAAGRLRLQCQYASSATIEGHLVAIGAVIDEFKPTRLVIDGLTAVKHIATPVMFHEFIAGLAALVKQRQIACVFTVAPKLLAVSSASDIEASTVLDAIILLRFVEIYGELHRGIAVLKMRGSDHDKAIRELHIGSSGSRVGAPFRTTTGIITGEPLQLLGPEGERIQALFTATGEAGQPPPPPPGRS